MVALKVLGFGGMIPAQDDRLLPENGAALSENSWLYSGTLDGMRNPVPVYTCVDPQTRKVYRIPRGFNDKDGIPFSYWLEFPNADVDVVRSPLANDTYERYYFCGSNYAPKYNSLSRIAAGSPALTLGIPQPTTAPSVSVSGTPPVTRSYVYTYISDFGEEGPPSDPTVATGDAAATWAITCTAPDLSMTTGRLLSKIRIYRTVTSSQGIATYYFVTDLTLPTVTFNDTISDTVVVGNNQLQSTGWTAPPTDLAGMTAMPNGMVAGFRGNEIWFCEPYRLHAWPAAYTLSVDYPISGLGVIGQTLIIATKGLPYAATGTNPSNMVLTNQATAEPCLSRGSIVSAPEGVYYASTNGIVLVNASGTRLVTQGLLTKDNWHTLMEVGRIRAARLGAAYYGFGGERAGCFETTAFYTSAFEQQDFTGSRTGMLVDFTDARVAYSTLTSTDPTYSVFNDEWTGEVLAVRNGHVYLIDVTTDASPGSYKWRSKVFALQRETSMGVLEIRFSVPAGTAALNPVPNIALVQTLAADQYGLVRVYADGRHVMTREIRISGQVMKLPSGFKAEYWQVEVEARVSIHSIQIATSAKELVRV